MSLSPGQLYFLNMYGYIKLNEWRLKSTGNAVNAKSFWQYQKGNKKTNGFEKHRDGISKFKWCLPQTYDVPEVNVNRAKLAILGAYSKGRMKILCPTCNHINEHGISDGHKACDRMGCPGYNIKIISNHD